MRGNHLRCVNANTFQNVREWAEVVERKKRWSPTLPCCFYESSVSVKENPSRKKVCNLTSEGLQIDKF